MDKNLTVLHGGLTIENSSNSLYSPECLTIHLSDQCNMYCAYCFTRQRMNSRTENINSIIKERVVLKAAHLVARTCAEKSLPFHVVFHGGGEPTYHWELLKQLVAITKQVASQYNIPWWGYIATNGILEDTQVIWIADNFNMIGLSCDGPPDIHNRQRPLNNNYPTFSHVQKTASILVEKQCPFTIRTTITPESVSRQSEIIAFLNQYLFASQFRFEPVYLVDYGNGGQKYAEDFVHYYILAQAEAKKRSCLLSYSGSRPEETHGSYCDVLRNVLRLTPEGNATNCFCSFGGESKTNLQNIIGWYDEIKDEYLIDHVKVSLLKHKAQIIPEYCHGCENENHCSHDCPDYCQIIESNSQRNPGIRCLINKLVARAYREN